MQQKSLKYYLIFFFPILVWVGGLASYLPTSITVEKQKSTSQSLSNDNKSGDSQDTNSVELVSPAGDAVVSSSVGFLLPLVLIKPFVITRFKTTVAVPIYKLGSSLHLSFFKILFRTVIQAKAP